MGTYYIILILGNGGGLNVWRIQQWQINENSRYVVCPYFFPLSSLPSKLDS